MNDEKHDPLDPLADLTTKTPQELEKWHRAQSRRNREVFPDPPRGPFNRAKGEINATWPTERWEFPLTAGSWVEVTSNHTQPRLMGVHGLRHVDDGGPLALLVGDARGLLTLRHRDPRGTWGDDLQATSARMPSVNILLPVNAWVVSADCGELPGPTGPTSELLARTKGVRGQT